MSTPNPGSSEAIVLGCTCPVLDNAHGAGMPYPDGPRWWINEDCPLHGTPTWSARSEARMSEPVYVKIVSLRAKLVAQSALLKRAGYTLKHASGAYLDLGSWQEDVNGPEEEAKYVKCSRHALDLANECLSAAETGGEGS